MNTDAVYLLYDILDWVCCQVAMTVCNFSLACFPAPPRARVQLTPSCWWQACWDCCHWPCGRCALWVVYTPSLDTAVACFRAFLGLPEDLCPEKRVWKVNSTLLFLPQILKCFVLAFSFCCQECSIVLTVEYDIIIIVIYFY